MQTKQDKITEEQDKETIRKGRTTQPLALHYEPVCKPGQSGGHRAEASAWMSPSHSMPTHSNTTNERKTDQQ